MKQRLGYLGMALCLLLAATSCRNASTSSAKTGLAEPLEGGCEAHKATAILWVDYKKGRGLSGVSSVRTAKVYANVYTDGTVRLISFCKKQPSEVDIYLRKRLAAYTIRKEIFEGDYMKPGRQYLQLRYVPDWIK